MESACDPRFEALIERRLSRDALDRHPGSVIGLWGDLRLAYLNPAWFEFAQRNGGMPAIAEHWGLGACYLDAISPVLRPYFARLFAGAPTPDTDLRPRAHEYQCPGPSLARRFHMDVFALPDREGYVVVNSLVHEQPHDPETQAPRPPDATLYQEASGLIRQCAHCRRIRRVDGTQWDWVPAWVADSPSFTSHGVCDLCLLYYYPDDPDDP